MLKLINIKFRRFLFILGLLLIISNLNYAQENYKETVTEPDIHPTFMWSVIQLIPSPQWSTSLDGMKFGMRWQVTPILYSFGINKKLSPWRYLIAEPLVRQSGSVELYFSPEFLNLEKNIKDKWLFRGGARYYFPLWQRGEYMSASLAASYYNFNGSNGFSYEAGIYLFAGILGIQTTYSPGFNHSEWIFTIRLKYF
ncbi:MAG: hypothetical protein ABFS12_08110 [Bacteroidota bacterium]